MKDFKSLILNCHSCLFAFPAFWFSIDCLSELRSERLKANLKGGKRSQGRTNGGALSAGKFLMVRECVHVKKFSEDGEVPFVRRRESLTPRGGFSPVPLAFWLLHLSISLLVYNFKFFRAYKSKMFTEHVLSFVNGNCRDTLQKSTNKPTSISRAHM